MKRTCLIAALALFLSLSTSQDLGAVRIDCDHSDSIFRGEDISIEIEEGLLVIECEEEEDKVEITEDYRLFINGTEIETDRSDRKLLKAYYNQYEDIVEYAGEIAAEGAKLGIKGANLGLKAVANIVKLVLDDYDSENFERDMERESEKIERAARKLEKKAEKLEDVAEEFEETHEKLRDSIDELDDLGWF